MTAPTPIERPVAAGRSVSAGTALSVVVAALLVVLGGTAPASAYWTSGGSAESSAATATLAPPTQVTVPSTTSEAVPVSWTASVGALTPSSYIVTRIDSEDRNGPTVACSVQAPTTSCTDPVDPGSYSYVVTAVYATWTRASTPSATVTVFPLASTPTSGTALLSRGKAASASSVEANSGLVAANAVDGDASTRWASASSDPQWLMVDLGTDHIIERVDLSWEGAYATAYQIQVSDTGTDGWRDIYSTTTGPGGNETHPVTGQGRYVRMLGTTRATGYGYSLWEFQIFGRITGPTFKARQSPSAPSTQADDSPERSREVDEPIPAPTDPVEMNDPEPTIPTEDPAPDMSRPTPIPAQGPAT
jgi:hypothetical protein